MNPGVQSQCVVGLVHLEANRFGCPDFVDVFERREALWCLQTTCVVISRNESFELRVFVVVIAFHRCLLDRAVHALDLTVRPEMVRLQPPAGGLIPYRWRHLCRTSPAVPPD